MQRTFGLCQLATSLKKGCGSETNNILTMLISETYYIGTLTSQQYNMIRYNYTYIYICICVYVMYIICDII